MNRSELKQGAGEWLLLGILLFLGLLVSFCRSCVARLVGFGSTNALMSINRVARGLSALRKLSKNGVVGNSSCLAAL
jgi:hypothetical protein